MPEDRNICKYCSYLYKENRNTHYCMKKPLINCKVSIKTPACEKFKSIHDTKKGE